MSDHDARAADDAFQQWEDERAEFEAMWREAVAEHVAAGRWVRQARGGVVSRAEYQPAIHGPLALSETPHDGPPQ